MVALELFPNSEIKVFKDKISSKMALTAYNHFSQADLNYTIEDDTVKIFIMGLVLIAVFVLVIFGLKLCPKKLKGEEKKHTTFDEMEGMYLREAMVKENVKGKLGLQSQSIGETNHYTSIFTNYEDGQDNPNEISDYFKSKKKEKESSDSE